MVTANFNRQQETLWFPVISGLGFDTPPPQLAESYDDFESAVDVLAGGKRFGVRSRNQGRYSQPSLERYFTEFTIRFSRPTGTRTEYHKLFVTEDGDIVPDFLAYGWVNSQRQFLNWLIIDVPTLQDAHKRGLLDQFMSNVRRNTDWRRSQLLPVSVPRLIAGQPSTFVQSLFPYHFPENHPALADFGAA